MYRNGFYIKMDELNEEYEDYEYDFNFLEDEISYKNITPDWFLHGNCDIFACYLHEKYGYEMKAIYDCDGELIHVYCTAEINDETVYIDVRGITDDWDEFITEFDDWDYSDDCPIKTFKTPKYYRKAKKDNDDIFNAAKAIEYENEDFYNVKCF